MSIWANPGQCEPDEGPPSAWSATLFLFCGAQGAQAVFACPRVGPRAADVATRRGPVAAVVCHDGGGGLVSLILAGQGVSKLWALVPQSLPPLTMPDLVVRPDWATCLLPAFPESRHRFCGIDIGRSDPCPQRSGTRINRTKSLMGWGRKYRGGV